MCEFQKLPPVRFPLPKPSPAISEIRTPDPGRKPIAPHLDQLLGRSKLDVPLNEPIVPHLEKLLGPAKTPRKIFETLDRQSREQNKSAIWFLPLSQPIAPHLDELLGPVK
ncbi:MAG: hypothetical protein ACKV2Q_08455 [Planctomycetaceae bacterium]